MDANIERAAILLLGMGEQQAAKVLRYMNQDQVEKVITAMNSLGDINQEQVQSAMYQFMGDSQRHTGMGVGNKEYIRSTLITALGNEKADSIIDKTLVDQRGGFEVLKWQTANTIYDLLHREHPQLIAVTMTMVGGDKVASVMKLFPDEIRIDLVNRIARLGSLSPIALDAINEVLEQLTSKLTKFKELPLGGAKKVADIVSCLDSELEDQILQSLGEIDEALSEQVQDMMFPFDKVAEIEPRSLQKVLREVPSEKLTVAIKACDEKTREIFFQNMSQRAAEMIKDDLDAMGPTPLSKVLEAQKEVVAVAQKMAANGEIVIGGAGEDLV